ncbi:MAG TPA: RidA family protein [Candidatus Cybelea sp.]|nr:RidA family protein [Candidatus Cybelea sp.]
MRINTRRTFFGKILAISGVLTAVPKLLAQPTAPPPSAAPGMADDRAPHSSHTHNGIFYISGTGANDGYGKQDHVLVTDPFEKHVTRAMDALKKSVERAGSTMDDIIHLEVFLCLPLADGVSAPTGTARFEAHKAQYEALNKIYQTYFSPGKAPSRACMGVDWIPGDSLIEIVGSATVVHPPTPPAGL